MDTIMKINFGTCPTTTSLLREFMQTKFMLSLSLNAQVQGHFFLFFKYSRISSRFISVQKDSSRKWNFTFFKFFVVFEITIFTNSIISVKRRFEQRRNSIFLKNILLLKSICCLHRKTVF